MCISNKYIFRLCPCICILIQMVLLYNKVLLTMSDEIRRQVPQRFESVPGNGNQRLTIVQYHTTDCMLQKANIPQ